MRTLLVTNSLPYANGSLHLGHMLEHIQSDIWVRAMRMQGYKVTYISASDAHGTPIMLKARSLNITPLALTEQMRAEHMATLAGFSVEYDNFYTTHSPENEALALGIYKTLQSKGALIEKTIKQAYDATANMFLPDRFVKGTCPKCHAPDQYGDSCEQCGATYSPLELKDGRSVLTNTPPIQKETVHQFFDLPQFGEVVTKWMDSGSLQPEVKHKLKEWFKEGLLPWDITRDAPYFGFEIPDRKGQYLYVWLDAPIGYMASFKNYAEQHNLDFNAYWKPDSTVELYHFIGKDITYFHGLFWPAVLSAADYRLPTEIVVHGFLTINGQKMSKSRGTFITANQYLHAMPADALRYYFAAKLNANLEDIDLSLQDFRDRINADLVGKLVNLASRSASFISQYFNNQLSSTLHDATLYSRFIEKQASIFAHYEARRFAAAIREIQELSDEANRYFDAQKPWAKIKDAALKEEVHAICTTSINLFYVLMTYLTPVTVTLAEKARAFLNIASFTLEGIKKPLLNHSLNTFSPLFSRITEDMCMTLENNAPDTPIEVAKPAVTSTVPAIKPNIKIDAFGAMDLRIAKIIAAEAVEGADKLLKLTIDLGLDTPRTVFSGIKSAFSPEDLIGKLTLVVANLEPRKMRFGLSEGMVLLASRPNDAGGKELFLLEPQQGAEPGMQVT